MSWSAIWRLQRSDWRNPRAFRGVDVILLGPQVRFSKDDVIKMVKGQIQLYPYLHRIME